MGRSAKPATASITSPIDNAVFTGPASITINASASDPDGTIAKVEFYQGTTKLGEDTTSPYSYAWSNVSASSYALTVKATDNGGAVTTSAGINVVVNIAIPPVTPDIIAPAVFITSPQNNSSVSGIVNITANASDNVAVTK